MINIGQDIKHITNGHLICDEFEIWIQKCFMSRVRQATKDVVKSEV